MSRLFETPSSSGTPDLHVLSACPLCETTYHPLTTRIVAERDDAHLLFLECRHCGSAVVAVVTTGQSGIHSVGTVTDLTSAELISRADRDAVVTLDDVTDLSAILSSPSTDFLSRLRT